MPKMRMSKKIRVALAVFIGCICAFLIMRFYVPETSDTLTLQMEITSEGKDSYQVYYVNDVYPDYSEDRSATASYGGGQTKEVSFAVPLDTTALRVDFGTQAASIEIGKLSVSYEHHSTELETDLFETVSFSQQITSLTKTADGYQVLTEGTDPYCVVDFTQATESLQSFLAAARHDVTMFYRVAMSVILMVLLVGAALVSEQVLSLLREVWHSRQLMFRLAKNDFKTRYAGSYLGIVWAFIQPVVTVLVYWFVFQVGFRSGDVGDYPYVLWLISGLIPWFFFSDAWNNATNSMIEYSYLVKKVVFKISILPIVKIISALFVHLFFICFLLFMFCLYGYWPDVYAIQVFYYSACMIVLVLGLSYLTSAVVVFFRDLGQIISIILQVGVWMTPIMWNVEMLGLNIRWIMKLNPMYYIVYGYRGALLEKTWFFEDLPLTVYFWLFAAIMFGLGTLMFKKLKVHFADVL